MKNNLVSIIIPSFNSELLIRDTLDSVMEQTHANWECIIVDDGSTDTTITILKDYANKDSRFKWFPRPSTKPKGPSSARNYGLENAKGDFVVFLDSDDLLLKTCLENRIVFANENSNFDFWVFKMVLFEPNREQDIGMFNILPLSNENENEFYLTLFLQGKFPFQTSCPLWKKSSLNLLRGFDEQMRMLEDPDLHTRAYKNGMQTKTAINFEADCFYRYVNDANREVKIKNYSNIAATTNFYFLNKNWIDDNENVKYNYKRIFNLYVFTEPSWFLLSKMIVLGWKNNLIQIKHVFLALLICLYTILKLDKVKGIGYSKLRNQFNSF
jgi:glycosyltransferase involved in cell wall biosynthesis